jgi:hypothetical protein
MKSGLLANSAIKFSTVLKRFIFTGLSILLFSCQSNDFKIDGFDELAWKENKMIDSSKCLSYREQNFKLLLNNKDLFIKMNDKELMDFLGEPDKESLSGHLKKSKMYCIKGCNECKKESYKKYLAFDFETFKRLKSVRIMVVHD